MLAVESQTTHYPTNNLLVCTSGHKLAISSLKQQNEKKEKGKKKKSELYWHSIPTVMHGVGKVINYQMEEEQKGL